MAYKEFKNFHIRRETSGELMNLPYLKIKNLILGKKYTLNLSFVSPGTYKRINKKYHASQKLGSALSFSYSNNFGEIIMSLSYIKKNFSVVAKNYREAVIFYLIHSMLHIKGFKHGVKMANLEKKYAKIIVKL